MRLTPSDEAAISALLSRAYGDDLDGRSFYQNRHHVRLVVRDTADIIGHLAIGLRAVRMGDRVMQAAGIADVATDPDHRGKGIASALLQAAIAEARASPAAIVMLFGDERIYIAAGFTPKPNPTRSVPMDDLWTAPVQERTGDSLMILPLGNTPWDDTALIDLLGFAF